MNLMRMGGMPAADAETGANVKKIETMVKLTGNLELDVASIINELAFEYPDIMEKLKPKIEGKHPLITGAEGLLDTLSKNPELGDEEKIEKIKNYLIKRTSVEPLKKQKDPIHFILTGKKEDDLYGLAQIILGIDDELPYNVRNVLPQYYPYYDTIAQNPKYEGDIQSNPEAVQLLIEKMDPIIKRANQRV